MERVEGVLQRWYCKQTRFISTNFCIKILFSLKSDILIKNVCICCTLRSVQSRIADIYIIGERAKRARHSLVCSIENRRYIILLASERSERDTLRSVQLRIVRIADISESAVALSM